MKSEGFTMPAINIKNEVATQQLFPCTFTQLLTQNNDHRHVHRLTTLVKKGSMEIYSHHLDVPRAFKKSTTVEIGSQEHTPTKRQAQNLINGNHLQLKREEQINIGLGTSIPIYPKSQAATPTLCSPHTGKIKRQVYYDERQPFSKQSSPKRASSAYKSQAEKKWVWGGANGVFNETALKKWHGCIIEGNS